MKLYVLFGQAIESYPGEYKPDALDIATEDYMNLDPTFFDRRKEFWQDGANLSGKHKGWIKLEVIEFQVDGGEIRNRLGLTLKPIKAFMSPPAPIAEACNHKDYTFDDLPGGRRCSHCKEWLTKPAPGGPGYYPPAPTKEALIPETIPESTPPFECPISLSSLNVTEEGPPPDLSGKEKEIEAFVRDRPDKVVFLENKPFNANWCPECGMAGIPGLPQAHKQDCSRPV